MAVSKEDIIALVKAISSSKFRFDDAVYYCKNWQEIAAQGHLDRLLSRSRVVEGQRTPNKTMWLFIYEKDGKLYNILTSNRHWKNERTLYAFVGSRHQLLVAQNRLEKYGYHPYGIKLKNDLHNA